MALMKQNESKILQNSVPGVLDDGDINDHWMKGLNKRLNGGHTRRHLPNSAKKTFLNTVRLACLHGF